MFNQRAILLAITSLVCLSGGAAALAAPAWVEQGPGPIFNGGDEGLPGPNPVVGATNVSGRNVVLAATLFDGGGVYGSTDIGVTFTRISGNGTSGLPNAGVSKLIADPGDPTGNRFYAGVPQAFGGGAAAGVYRSDD